MPPPSTIPPNRRKKPGPQPIAPAPASVSSYGHGHASLTFKHLPQHVQQSSPSASVSSLSADQDDEDDDDEYTPRTLNSASKKTNSLTVNSSGSGSKSAAGTKRKQPPTNAQNNNNSSGNGKSNKMSREALRKANHSLIERRRREKINAALGELRIMVPGLGEEGGKAGEFKLEVLERTVAHMKDLKNHIKHLESIISSHGIDIPLVDGVSKDKDEDDDENHDDEDCQMKCENATHSTATSKPVPSRPVNMTTTTSYSHQGHNANNQYHTHSRSKSYTYSQNTSFGYKNSQPSTLSPYPSPKPEHESLSGIDPNETETETNLPPPLTKAASRINHQHHNVSRHSSPNSISTPSVANLLAQVGVLSHPNSPTPPPPQQPVSRPAPPPQSNNPIFLPFPAPSPTSPFMNAAASYSGSSSYANSNSSSSSGPSTIRDPYISDPSPFLAPISGMSLFGGVLNLDPPPPSPADSLKIYNGNNIDKKQHSPPLLSLPPSNTKEKLKDMPPEEAANLLLAFSSPDVMRPQTHIPIITTNTTTTTNHHVNRRERRMTLDSDDFKLDSTTPSDGHSSHDDSTIHQRSDEKSRAWADPGEKGLRGKSAMDFLKMTEAQR
ncbi:uncharacterized protein L201_007098 [Kwoniella dendrophila CBS 6074]|uniref:BHLH domain-containing protein n=1 Tax=Kwoniella dendrophila CBS 6074 TaxID=1295534 RepID=A0AAX4K433_9TREE